MTFQNYAHLDTVYSALPGLRCPWTVKGEMSCHFISFRSPIGRQRYFVFISLIITVFLCIHWVNTIANERKKILGWGGRTFIADFPPPKKKKNLEAYRHDCLVTLFVAVSCRVVFVFSLQVSDAFLQSRGKRDVFCLPWTRCCEERRTL